MSKREADGYCAWHVQAGFNMQSMASSEAVSWDNLSEYCDPAPQGMVGYTEEMSFAGNTNEFVEAAKIAGWQIRPVYISTEPPEETPSIDAAGLHKLISWAKWMASEHRRSLETLNCDDSLNEILEDLKLLLPKSEGEGK